MSIVPASQSRMDSTNNLEIDKRFIFAPYSKKQLSAFYRVTPKTFRMWLRKLKLPLEDVGRLYTVNQVMLIVEKLGKPPGTY